MLARMTRAEPSDQHWSAADQDPRNSLMLAKRWNCLAATSASTHRATQHLPEFSIYYDSEEIEDDVITSRRQSDYLALQDLSCVIAAPAEHYSLHNF